MRPTTFNAGDNVLDGVPIKVEIVATDGLTALGRWDRNEYGALPADVRPDELTEEERAALEDFPTAWIPDSRYLVELANASYKERLGRDVFLTDGEYRARPYRHQPLCLGCLRQPRRRARAEIRRDQLGDDPRCGHRQPAAGLN